MHIFCLMLLLRPGTCKSWLNSLDSLQAWQTIVRALSAYSETKWLVSVAFLSREAKTRSRCGSRSLEGNSLNITWRVMHEFFATWDRRLSFCFTTSLIHSLVIIPFELASSSLWNMAMRFTMLRLSNTLCQSSDLRFSIHCLNCKSGFLNGSSCAM